MQAQRYSGHFFQHAATAFFLSVVLSACGGMRKEYVPPSIILPPHIKTISVRPFENETSIPGIGNKLWLATTDEFIRDGRIAYSDKEENAEGTIVGALKQYHLSPLSHDVNGIPLEYQMWVVMDLKFLDRSNHQYLWEEPLLEQKIRYFVESAPGGRTEEEAREELWERFARDIVRRTIEGFGSVTSSSPKAVPKKESVPENPPPPYPSTAPF